MYNLDLLSVSYFGFFFNEEKSCGCQEKTSEKTGK